MSLERHSANTPLASADQYKLDQGHKKDKMKFK